MSSRSPIFAAIQQRRHHPRCACPQDVLADFEPLLCQLRHARHWVHDVCYNELRPNLSRRDPEVQLANTVVSECMSVSSHQFPRRQLLTHRSIGPEPERTRVVRRGLFLWSQKMHRSVITKILERTCLSDVIRENVEITQFWRISFLYDKTQKGDRAPRCRWIVDVFSCDSRTSKDTS